DPHGIVNAATLARFGTPGYGTPEGSIATIFGQNLAPTTAVATQVPLPTSLAGVSVTMGSRALPLYYVSPRQVNFELPNQSLLDPLSIIVNTPNGASDPEPIPGFFSRVFGIF